MIRLYGIRASRAARCIWMLEELGLEYENVPVSFLGDAQKPEYLAINPNGRVPALVDDDGTVVWESLAINLYLAEKYDRGLRPRSAAERGHALQWSFWAATEVESGVVDAFVHRVMLPEGQRDAAIADAGEAKLQRPLPVLDRHLAERSYLLGEAFTVADLNVCSVLGIARVARIDLAKQPHVQRWLAACLSRPAAQKAFGPFSG